MPSIGQQDYIFLDCYENGSTQCGITSAKTFLDLRRLADRPVSMLSVCFHAKVYNLVTTEFDREAFYTIVTYRQSLKEIVFFGAFGSTTLTFTEYGSDANMEGFEAIQEAADYYVNLPRLRKDSDGYLYLAGISTYVAVDGKYVNVTLNEQDDSIETLSVSEVEIPEGVAFVNISEEDLMKLIGAPRIN